MVSIFILDLSFINSAFQVKHLMIEHVLEWVVYIDFFSPATLMGPMVFCCWEISCVAVKEITFGSCDTRNKTKIR